MVFAGASADATVSYFLTTEALVPGDTDATADLYRYAGGAVTLAR